MKRFKKGFLALALAAAFSIATVHAEPAPTGWRKYVHDAGDWIIKMTNWIPGHLGH
jgi:hypothetical protein